MFIRFLAKPTFAFSKRPPLPVFRQTVRPQLFKRWTTETITTADVANASDNEIYLPVLKEGEKYSESDLKMIDLQLKSKPNNYMLLFTKVCIFKNAIHFRRRKLSKA